MARIEVVEVMEDAFYPIEVNGKGITIADAVQLVKDLQRVLLNLADDMVRSTSRRSLPPAQELLIDTTP